MKIIDRSAVNNISTVPVDVPPSHPDNLGAGEAFSSDGKRKIVGNYAWWRGAELVAQSVLYENETERDAVNRARQNFEITNPGELFSILWCVSKFYPSGN
jgi:hypothetical protein